MNDPRQSAVDMAAFIDAVVDLMARKLRPDAMKRELDMVFKAHGLTDSSSQNEVLLLCAARAAKFLQGLPDVFAADSDQGAEATEELRVVLAEHPLPNIEPLIADEDAADETVVRELKAAAAKPSTEGPGAMVAEGSGANDDRVAAPVGAEVRSVVLGNDHDGSAENNGHGAKGVSHCVATPVGAGAT